MKSGTGVNLVKNVNSKPEFRVTVKPDFLQALNYKAFYDSKGEYNQSENHLGIIYRRVTNIEYSIPEKTNDRPLHERVNAV